MDLVVRGCPMVILQEKNDQLRAQAREGNENKYQIVQQLHITIKLVHEPINT